MRNSKFRTPWFLSCLILLVGGSLFLQSCKKEYFELDRVKDATWNPEVAVPLIKSTITVPEVLGRFDDEEIITIDPATGLLALRYNKEIFALAGQDFLVFPRQSFQAPVPVTPQDVANVTTNGSSTQAISAPVTLQFANGEQITRAIFSSGELRMDFTQQTSYNTLLDFTIPELTLNGVPFTASSIDPSVTTSVVQPLAGYELNPGANNQITINIGYRYSGSGGTPGVGVDVDVTVGQANSTFGPGYSLIEGDFGTQSASFSDRVNVKLFENELGGVIVWDSAIVRGYFTNDFGIPLNLAINPFRGVNTETLDSLDIQGFANINIPAGTIGGVPGRDSFNLVGNTGGANINDIANLNPDKIAFAATVQANGGGANNNFARDTDSLTLDLEAILPFDGKAQDFSRGTVAAVDIFPLDGDVEEIVSVTIRITIDNGFPAEAFVQAYFCDSTFVDSLAFAPQQSAIIDSAFASGRSTVFASPTPDQFGRIDQNNKARSVLDIVLTRDQLERLEARNMTKIAVQGWLESFNMGQTRIKIFNNYSLDLYVGMKVEAKVKVQL